MTTSEDQLVAKLRKWTYNDARHKVFSQMPVDSSYWHQPKFDEALSEVLVGTGWILEEYLTECGNL